MQAQEPEASEHIEYAEVLRVEPVHLPTPLAEESTQCPPSPQLDEPEHTEHPTETTDTDCIQLQDALHESAPTVFYDVDYSLHGIKFRSRLPYDPGNLLQVRLSVTPMPLPEQPPADTLPLEQR